jgi:8-oxo-dGTP pyrophosphatase MutT (NUDIX family)
MQQRDDRPDIIYPGHWSCFGGEVRGSETALETLRRELREELEFEPRHARAFARFEFDLTPVGRGRFHRSYFEVSVTETQSTHFVLHEGAALRAWNGEELLHAPWVAPHDAFAIWLHLAGARIAPAGQLRNSRRS